MRVIRMHNTIKIVRIVEMSAQVSHDHTLQTTDIAYAHTSGEIDSYTI